MSLISLFSTNSKVLEVAEEQVKQHLEELAHYLKSRLESGDMVSNAKCSTSSANVTWLVQNGDCRLQTGLKTQTENKDFFCQIRDNMS